VAVGAMVVSTVGMSSSPFHKLPYTYPYGRSVDKTMIVGAHHGA
jgi:hypothetical protein